MQQVNNYELSTRITTKLSHNGEHIQPLLKHVTSSRITWYNTIELNFLKAPERLSNWRLLLFIPLSLPPGTAQVASVIPVAGKPHDYFCAILT